MISTAQRPPRILPMGVSNVLRQTSQFARNASLPAALGGTSAKAQEVKTVFVIAMENHNWTQPAKKALDHRVWCITSTLTSETLTKDAQVCFRHFVPASRSQAFQTAFERGSFNRVPVMNGTNHDQGFFISLATPDGKALPLYK